MEIENTYCFICKNKCETFADCSCCVCADCFDFAYCPNCHQKTFLRLIVDNYFIEILCVEE